MKKETRKYLIIIVVIIVVLGAAAAALLLTGDSGSEENTSSVSSETGISLTSYEEADVASVEVIRRDDDYSYKVLVSVDDGGIATYSLEGVDASVPLSTSKLKVIAKCGYLLSATKDLGETDALSEYGLDDPQLIVKTIFNDGTIFNYSVGDESPSGGYYIMPEGTNQLYTANLNANLFKNQLELVDTSILSVGDAEAIAAGTAANVYTYISISGQNYEEPITIDNDAENTFSVYQMTSPAQYAGSSCNENLMSSLCSALDSVSAESVAVIQPTEEDLEAYGLDDPVAMVHFRANDENNSEDEEAEDTAEEHTLKAGTVTEDNLYPLMVDDIPVIYLVEKDTVDLWYDADPFSFRSSLILLPSITNVTSVSLQTATEEHTFTLSRTLNEEESTEDEPSYDYSVVGSDDQELTYTTFQKFYQDVIGIQLLEESAEEVSGTPYMTITYRYYEGGSDKIAFYTSTDNSRQCIVAVNGVVCGTTKMTTLNTVLNNANEMEEDRNVAVSD